jgi:hypothetical protein
MRILSAYAQLQKSPCHFYSRGICKPVLIMQENIVGQSLDWRFASNWYFLFQFQLPIHIKDTVTTLFMYVLNTNTWEHKNNCFNVSCN